MEKRWMRGWVVTGILLKAAVMLDLERAEAQPLLTTNGNWTYTLLQDSQLTEDCPVCDRIPIVVPLRGKFDLRLLEENPLFARYAVENIDFTASGPLGPTYKVTGQGAYQVGGEIAVVQEMTFEVQIENVGTKTLCYLTNETGMVQRRWPMIQIQLHQTNGTMVQVYHLDLAAAPLQEIWLSTRSGFYSGIPAPVPIQVTGGDIISSAGRLVKRNQELTARLGFMPVVPDLGLDAMDILPGGEIAFSMEQNEFSETLGMLHEGDVLSDRGKILHTYTDLMAAFAPQPPVADQGLDALHSASHDEIYFSVKQDFFSELLGRTIRRGDLLSNRGLILKTNEQLLAPFNPAEPKKDYGLDAVWVWPSGEIWFSTEEGFYGPHFEFYAPGDLLSDQGYVVFRNLELVSGFAPLEDLGDFGLDALFIVSDASPSAPAPRFTGVNHRAVTGTIELEWDGAGRVFQVQRANDAPGPYSPLSEIVPDRFFHDTSPMPSQSFYRLRQW